MHGGLSQQSSPSAEACLLCDAQSPRACELCVSPPRLVLFVYARVDEVGAWKRVHDVGQFS